MGLLVDSGYCMVLLYAYCNFSHNTSLNIANRVQNTLIETDFSKLDMNTVKEVKFARLVLIYS